MRKSDRPIEKQAELENEPKAKKNRADNRTSNIAILDNGTMVEAFKHLNYMQLAKGSLVSKRFSNLIRTHRHSLPLLNVDCVRMSEFDRSPVYIKFFDKVLSLEAYNEWVICNHYSKQVPLESQIAGMGATWSQYGGKYYMLWGDAIYKDPNRCQSSGCSTVIYARAELNHDNWPLFQHFVRLLTDPFIYIRHAKLDAQRMLVNLLSGAINSDSNRLQCKGLDVNLAYNMQNFIKWIKDHVRCEKVRIIGYDVSNYDKELLDFFTTGTNCTSEVDFRCSDLCKVVVAFVKKFMNLKSCDENQLVESIWGNLSNQIAEGVKRIFAAFIIKEETNEDRGSIEQVFEFVNNDIGKKLQLGITIMLRYRTSEFSLKIVSLK